MELINFAHGDVFMIGGMIAATFAIQVFDLGSNPALSTLIPVILVALAAAMIGCALLNATIERVAYKPLRGAPRLVPLITAVGVSFILENVALRLEGAAPGLAAAEHASDRSGLHGRDVSELRHLHAGTSSSSSP